MHFLHGPWMGINHLLDFRAILTAVERRDRRDLKARSMAVLPVWLPSEGAKRTLKCAADEAGESVSEFVRAAIRERMTQLAGDDGTDVGPSSVDVGLDGAGADGVPAPSSNPEE